MYCKTVKLLSFSSFLCIANHIVCHYKSMSHYVDVYFQLSGDFLVDVFIYSTIIMLKACILLLNVICQVKCQPLKL